MTVFHAEKGEHTEAGYTTKTKGYLFELEGLPGARVGDLIVSEHGTRALVTALSGDSVEALMLDRAQARVAQRFHPKDHGVPLWCGDHLRGRVISSLGEPIDGGGSFSAEGEPRTLDVQAPGMHARRLIDTQLVTGLALLDVLLPLGKGQRELVVGPTASGKTVFLEEVTLSASRQEMVCIYALVGKPASYVRSVVSTVHSEKDNNVIVIAAFSDDPAPLIYIAPTVAFTVAEYFAHNGKDVLLVLDDLGTHAKYIREIALLAGRIPGRESYPGDVFYEHAHLMERAGAFNKSLGGASITLLPVLETGVEDLTNLVSTNLMAATDGHLFFSPASFAEGHFPSIVPTESVTRVGRKTQSNLGKELSVRLQALLADFERQRDYARFGTQLSEHTRLVIRRGEVAWTLLRQERGEQLPLASELVLLALVFSSFFDTRDAAFAKRNRSLLVEALGSHKALAEIRASAARGTITLKEFIRRLNEQASTFESICRA